MLWAGTLCSRRNLLLLFINCILLAPLQVRFSLALRLFLAGFGMCGEQQAQPGEAQGSAGSVALTAERAGAGPIPSLLCSLKTSGFLLVLSLVEGLSC